MSDLILYLITRLDFLNCLFSIGLAAGIIGVIVGSIVKFALEAHVEEKEVPEKPDDDDPGYEYRIEKYNKVTKEIKEYKEGAMYAGRIAKISVIIGIVSLLLVAITPPTKSAMMAYCVSKVEKSETLENINALIEKLAEKEQ